MTGAPQQATPEPIADQPFTEEEMRYHWLMFANGLPIEYAADAGRLKILKPCLKEGFLIEAPVDNQLAASYLNKILPLLTDYLKRALRNQKVNITFPITTDSSSASRLVFSPREIFATMKNKNNHFARLVKQLDLQLE